MGKEEKLTSQDKTLRLLALITLEGMPQKSKIQVLDKAGFGPSEIAELIGSTPKAISVRLAEFRRATKTRQGARRK